MPSSKPVLIHQATTNQVTTKPDHFFQPHYCMQERELTLLVSNVLNLELTEKPRTNRQLPRNQCPVFWYGGTKNEISVLPPYSFGLVGPIKLSVQNLLCGTSSAPPCITQSFDLHICQPKNKSVDQIQSLLKRRMCSRGLELVLVGKYLRPKDSLITTFNIHVH